MALLWLTNPMKEKQQSQSAPQILSDFSIAFILKPICSCSPWKSFPERKQVTHVGFFLFCAQTTIRGVFLKGLLLVCGFVATSFSAAF